MSAGDAPPVARPLGAARTARLDLRPIGTGDETLLAPVFAKVEVWRFPYGRGLSAPETARFVERQARDWAQLGFGLWLVTERASGRALGFVGLSVPRFMPEILPAVEVGWRLDPDAWGRGYAPEAATAALDGAFGVLELDEVCSIPQAGNAPSVRVAEGLGMRRVRDARLAATDVRAAIDVHVYAIGAGGWRARRARPATRTDAAI